MSRPRLTGKDFMALVETLREAEYVHPSQEVKRKIFRRYGIPQSGKDPMLTALFYDIMRKLGVADKIIERALGIPTVYILDPWLRAGLRVAAYMLHLSRIPIREDERQLLRGCVAKLLSERTHPFVGMFYWNAITGKLSKFEYKPKDEIEELELKYCLPAWFIARLRQLLGPEEAERLFKVFNKPTVICVRVNTLKATVEEVIEALRKEGKNPRPGRYVPTILRFKGPYSFERSRLLAEGKVIPQEEACALASIILDPKPGETVVDMCAAPGGKTTHLAELMKNKGVIYAFDIYEDRIRRLKETLERAGVEIAEVMMLDARKAPAALGEEIADKVLLDPPCSSSGTLAKYPEIRWRLRPEKVRELAEYQYQLLRAAVRLVKPGGRLLYTVCSVLPEEGEELIRRILREYSDCLRLVRLDGPYDPGFLDGTMRAWPHRHGTVGFFYALLEKTRSSRRS